MEIVETVFCVNINLMTDEFGSFQKGSITHPQRKFLPSRERIV